MGILGDFEFRDAETPGWEIHETQTICDGLVVRWNPKADRGLPGRFEVSASRNGVMVSGYMGHAIRDVDRLVAVLREAERRCCSIDGGPQRMPAQDDKLRRLREMVSSDRDHNAVGTNVWQTLTAVIGAIDRLTPPGGAT